MDELYIHVISHEIGQLIRLNSQSNDCEKRCVDGSFPDVLEDSRQADVSLSRQCNICLHEENPDLAKEAVAAIAAI